MYIVKAFAQKGYHVNVLTPKQGEMARRLGETGACLLPLKKKRFNSIELESHAFETRKPLTWKTPLLMLHEVLKILIGVAVVSRAIRRTNPRLVYINEHVAMQASLAARIHRIPSVIQIRSLLLNGAFGIRRFLFSRLILRFNDRIFAITESEAQQLQPRNSEEKKVKVIGEFFSSLDAQVPGVRECRAALGLPLDKRIVTMLGGVEEIKGTLVFLRAAELVTNTFSKVFFVLAGTHQTLNERMRSYFSACAVIAERLKQNGWFVDLGQILGTMELINASDVIVAPSMLTHFSRPVIESWGLGKPVVCSKTEHMRNLVDHGCDGLLFEIGDHKMLAKCLLELLVNRKLRERMGKEGKNKVEERFNAKANTAAILEECNALVEGKTSLLVQNS